MSNTIGTILGGAPAPFVAAWIYNTTGNSNAVGAYITALAAVSLISVVMLGETHGAGQKET